MERLPDLSGLAPADKDTLIRSLCTLVRELQGRLELLEGENRKLRGQLSKDSMNSSKPPSSDGLRKKTRSLRSKSERPAGGVSGHPGHHLKRSDTPDHIINHEPPSHCDTCGRIPEAHGFEARQVFELPRVKLEVTGHRAWFARCSCGRRHQAEFPEPLKAAVQYGPRLKAFAVYLHHHHMVPVERTADILESLCGVRPSGGTVLNFVEEAASRIEPTWERIGQALRHTPVLGADESGMRTAGKAWLHVLTNPLPSWLGVHSKRGREAFDEFGLLPDFDGTLVHDGFVSYKGCSCRHALCNRQRIRREYETLIRKGCKLNPPEPPDGWPGKTPQSSTVNLLRRLEKQADEVLRFTTDPRVPFSNNDAEREVRMPKVKLKVAGTFRTRDGARYFCILRSCFSTLKKQGQHLLDCLEEALRGNDPTDALAL